MGPGRAGPFRSGRTSPSRHDRFSHRATAPWRDIIPWSALCGDERDRYVRRSVAARLNETERETRGAPCNFLRPFNRPRRTFFEFSAWYGCCLARLVSLVFFCSQRETSENPPITVAQPVIFNEFLPLIRFRGKKSSFPKCRFEIYRRNIDFSLRTLCIFAARIEFLFRHYKS